ncbi:MAG: hypothetical protein JRJ50_14810 [Deltaproteobacteria bacterium]|nr:hypothetical protein [Deltaproteobacteria bacterium]
MANKVDIKHLNSFVPPFVRLFFTKGHERTLRAKENVAVSFVFKGVTIAIGFVIVPLAIDYLDPTRYGVFLTISSVAGWFSFFDIGLGNGLRNKFTEAMAKDDKRLGKIYVSTTYVILGAIVCTVFLIFATVHPFITWSRVFNPRYSRFWDSSCSSTSVQDHYCSWVLA